MIDRLRRNYRRYSDVSGLKLEVLADMINDPENEPLLTPTNSALVFICPQAKFASSLKSAEQIEVFNSLVEIATDAESLSIPLLAFVESTTAEFDALDSRLRGVVDDQAIHFSSAAHPWRDEAFVERLNNFGRRRLVVGGLTTEGPVSFAVLSALADGFSVYVLADGCAGVSASDHETALARMAQAGGVLVTTAGVRHEWAAAGDGDAVT